MHFIDGLHESSYADHVITKGLLVIWHHFFSSIIHSIELSNLIGETNVSEKSLNLISRSWKLKVILCDSHLCESRGEQEINCLRLITIVIIVCNRSLFFEGDICSDSGATKYSVFILWSSDCVSGTWFHTFS
jgi:hypothetical protein